MEAIGATGTSSLVLAGIVALGFVGLMSLPVTRAWGVELWSWAFAYPVYIFMAAGFSTSILRYLLLAFPLALVAVPPVKTSADRVARAVMVGLWALFGLAGQYLWISHLVVYLDPNQSWGIP
jgi:hypothetical protein